MNINYTKIFLLLINILLIQHLVLGKKIEVSAKEENNEVNEQLNTVNSYCPGTFHFTGSVKTESDCNTVANGSIALAVSGGTQPYSFKWTSGQTTQNISNLLMGDYTVTVTDATGCMGDTSFHLNKPYNIYFANTQNICPTDSKGVINIYSATSCMCSYSHCTTEFTKDGQPVGTIMNTTQSTNPGSALQNLKSGVYHYKFTSTYGCVIYDSVKISPDAFSLAIQQTKETSPGAHDGTAKANVSGGTSPYSYLWNDPASQATQTATGLVDNHSYAVTVTDSKSCQVSSSIVINSVTGIGVMAYDMRGVMVYPNPAVQEFTVEIEKDLISSYNLIIHDANGKVVREYGSISDEKFKIEQDNLSPGLYQATMIYPNGNKSFKIMFSK